MRPNNLKYLKTGDFSDGTRLETASITAKEHDSYMLNNGLLAHPSASLGVSPAVGDFISYIGTEEGIFIVHLLIAKPRERTSITYPFSQTVALSATHIELNAKQTMRFRALGELSLETGRNICISCENLFQSAVGSVVNMMSNWVQQCDQGSIQAKDLLSTDAGSHIITADEDLRLDAKRINMG